MSENERTMALNVSHAAEHSNSTVAVLAYREDAGE